MNLIRIKSKDLKAYEKVGKNWKVVKKEFPELISVVNQFKVHRNFKILVDTKDSRFLKGQLNDGKEQGARIDVLPNGEKLEKAYSLFSPHLKLHEEMSHDHWDVMYQNKGGGWSYVYTLEKRKKHRALKYKKVNEFEKRYLKLVRNVQKGLIEGDEMAVPMLTLLKTYMRIGNETYFKVNGHKGLTTLMKKNVSVKGNRVSFSYLGKDGVPIDISQRFSTIFIKRFKGVLRGKKKDDFIFSKGKGILHENDFKKAFVNYCGCEFYPHIVRSHYATMKVKKFLDKNKKFTKKDVEKLYLSVAHDLGHKKFNKKTQEWQEHYVVTVNSYISPILVEKIDRSVK